MQRSKVFQFLEKSNYTCILKVYNAEINTSELLGKKVHASYVLFNDSVFLQCSKWGRGFLPESQQTGIKSVNIGYLRA